MNKSNTTPKLYIPNKILNNWDPRTMGFTREYTRSEGNTLHTYYKLNINNELSIHISCSQYPSNPQKRIEQCVELSICDHFELLSHIDSKQKMATLIRSLSGKSRKHFARLAKQNDNI